MYEKNGVKLIKSGVLNMKKSISETIKAYRADDSLSQSYHFHNGYELIFIEKGSSEFIINDKQMHYHQNDIIFINQMERHQMRPLSDEYIRYVIIFEPEYFDQFIHDHMLCSIFKQRPANFQNGFHLPEPSAAFALELLKACVNECENKNQFFKMAIMSNTLALLIHLYRNFTSLFPSVRTNSTTAAASNIQNYIDQHYLEDLSVDSLAKEFHLNRYYIMEFFKDVTGYTLKQYIILKRISYAKNLLYYSDKNVSEIAAASGFNNVSNFIRAFKNHEKVTPLKFRNLNHVHLTGGDIL